MITKNIIAVISAICLAGCEAQSQQSAEQAAKQAASSFVSKIGHSACSGPANLRTSSTPFGQQAFLTWGNRFFAFDSQITKVTGFSDNDAIDRIRNRSSLPEPFANSPTAVARANAFLAKIALTPAFRPFRVQSQRKSRIPKSQDGQTVVSYEFVWKGIGNKLVGNHITIALDSATGELVSFKIRDNYQYGDTTLQLSLESALEKGKAILRHHLPNLPLASAKVTATFILPNSEFGSTVGPELMSQRRVEYGFDVTVKHKGRIHSVFLSRSGQCLGGAVSK